MKKKKELYARSRSVVICLLEGTDGQLQCVWILLDACPASFLRRLDRDGARKEGANIENNGADADTGARGVISK